MNKFKILLFLVLGFLLQACAHNLNDNRDNLIVHLTKDKTCLLPSLYLNEPLISQQLLNISYNGNTQQIIALLEGESSTLKLSVLSPLGIRLYDATYQDGFLSSKSLIEIKELPPASQVLFDIMLCILDSKAIQEVLPSGFKLKEDHLKRELLDDKDQMVSVVNFKEVAGKKIASSIHHAIFGYSIEFSDLN